MEEEYGRKKEVKINAEVFDELPVTDEKTTEGISLEPGGGYSGEDG